MSRAGYWCGPGGRDDFYRTLCNDPFWKGIPELDAMTDREVSEYLLAQYVKGEAAGRTADWEQQVAANDAAFAAKPPDEQRAAYLVMCRDHGIAEADAVAEWDRLQREGE
jgi:hypothetical protein